MTTDRYFESGRTPSGQPERNDESRRVQAFLDLQRLIEEAIAQRDESQRRLKLGGGENDLGDDISRN